MHESIMSTGKPEDRAHYQAVCDALNSMDGHRPSYGWHLVDLEGHTMGHAWKMVYRSDRRLTQPSVNGMLSLMHGASIALRHTRTMDHCVVRTETVPTGLDPEAYGPMTKGAACEFADRMNATQDSWFYEPLQLGAAD